MSVRALVYMLLLEEFGSLPPSEENCIVHCHPLCQTRDIWTANLVHAGVVNAHVLSNCISAVT